MTSGTTLPKIVYFLCCVLWTFVRALFSYEYLHFLPLRCDQIPMLMWIIMWWGWGMCLCGGQKSTLWRCSSPSIFAWVWEIELRSGFSNKCSYPLSHLIGPGYWNLPISDPCTYLMKKLLIIYANKWKIFASMCCLCPTEITLGATCVLFILNSDILCCSSPMGWLRGKRKLEERICSKIQGILPIGLMVTLSARFRLHYYLLKVPLDCRSS